MSTVREFHVIVILEDKRVSPLWRNTSFPSGSASHQLIKSQTINVVVYVRFDSLEGLCISGYTSVRSRCIEVTT